MPLPGVSSIVMRREGTLARSWTISSTSSKAWASPRRSASGPSCRPCWPRPWPQRNVGLDFDDTDFAFLEQTGFLLGVVVAVAVLGVIDRRRGADTSGRDPSS